MNKHSPIPAKASPVLGNVADASVAPVCNTGASVTYSFRTELCIHHDTATATSCDECDRGYVDSVCVDCGELRPLNDDGECRRCHDSNTLSSADFELLYPTRIAPLPSGWNRIIL